MTRAYNFSPGPATLPTEVLEQVASELLEWHDTGASIIELNHRGPDFREIAEQAQADMRELLSIPDNYHILFLHGGGRTQFAMVPLNLLGEKTTADYINTGLWSSLAIREAEKFCKVNVAASSEHSKFTEIPDRKNWQLNEDAAYVHIVTNETVNGVEFLDVPDVGQQVLVGDMSSDIMGVPLDVSKFGLIYAGAQKNLGPAGVTIVIIREDLVGMAKDSVPSMLNYKNHVEQKSLYNTPCTFSWYVVVLMLQWLKKQGGLRVIAEQNEKKAQLLYEEIDQSDFYSNPVNKAYRSRMNVVFNLADDSLNEAFLKGAKDAGLINLNGHRFAGGMRASIYNAMPTKSSRMITMVTPAGPKFFCAPA